MHVQNTGKREPLMKAQNNNFANVAGSVSLGLFIDGSGKCKLPSTPPSTGLNKIKNLNMVIVNFEF